jgi:hypothetical protein
MPVRSTMDTDKYSTRERRIESLQKRMSFRLAPFDRNTLTA